MKKPKKARKIRRISKLKLKIRAGKLKKAKHAVRARKVKKAKKLAKQVKAVRIKKAGKAKKAGKTAQIKRAQKPKRGFFSFLFGGAKRTQAEKHASAVKGKTPKIKKMKKAKKVKKTKSAKKSAAKAKETKISKLKARSEEKKRKIEEQKKLIVAKKAMIAEERKKIAAEKAAMKNAKKEKEEKLEKLEKEKQARERKERKAKESVKQEYIRTDIPGFDALLKDGIPEGSAVLVEGGPGSGKTIFCLALAKNMCKQKKKVLYMSFEEPEYRLRTHLTNFGADVDQLQKQGLLYIKRFNALDIARSVEALLSEAKKELLIDVQPVLIPHDFEPDIVVIDSLTSIGSAFSGEESRFRIYMEQLFRYLESHQITSFLIRETSNPTHLGSSFVEKAEAVSFLSDGIIALYNVFMDSGKRKRAIEIIKMRGTSIDRKVVECEIIGSKGLVVYPNRTPQGKYKLT